MDDLVERLRGWLDEDKPIRVILNEAADRIEALEKELLVARDAHAAQTNCICGRVARREALEEVEKLVKDRRVMGEPVEDLSEYGSGAYSECVAIIAAIRALKEKE